MSPTIVQCGDLPVQTSFTQTHISSEFTASDTRDMVKHQQASSVLKGPHRYHLLKQSIEASLPACLELCSAPAVYDIRPHHVLRYRGTTTRHLKALNK